jgi:hypothetical protein
MIKFNRQKAKKASLAKKVDYQNSLIKNIEINNRKQLINNK